MKKWRLLQARIHLMQYKAYTSDEKRMLSEVLTIVDTNVYKSISSKKLKGHSSNENP